MSIHVASSSASIPVQSTASAASKSLLVGLTGLVATLLGLAVSGGHAVATSYLVGISFWTAIAIGMMLLILIHHIFDASWSVILRRQYEHALSAIKWLGLLFIPLIIASFYQKDMVWSWMNPEHIIHNGHKVANDVLYAKKAGFLNFNTFVILTVVCFLSWIVLASFLRKASFTQDTDGDPKWTHLNRKLAAAGIPLMALTLTLISIYWIKSLEYHWFSTMYGVWFFANCLRGAYSFGVLIMLWLWQRGDYKGILNPNHLYSIGMMMFAFTVFWAYVTFSQYFLIWNANVPEETFWYNLRELNADGSTNQWWYVGMVLLFGHFLVPFLYLLSYKHKVVHSKAKGIAIWILAIILVDLCYNILPSMKDAHGDPVPFLSINLLWVLTSVIGVGGVCFWAYFRSFPMAKLIPIRDPRIKECLTYHE